MIALFYFCLAVACLSLVACGLLFTMHAQTRRIQRRLETVIAPGAAMQLPQKPDAREQFLALAKKLRGYVGISETPALRARFASAGIHSPHATEIYFAARMLGPIAGILLGTFVPGNPFFCALCFGAVAYLAPEFWLDRKGKKRRNTISRSLPDAIDLLVVCVDAGLGMDQAMLRVGQELAISHPAINEEFTQVNLQQRSGLPRIDAWKQMAARTKLPEIQGFVNMLVQTERFGTPIARALSIFSDDLRLRRKQRVEERAAKTTVKMLFPLVLFIFPCIFIVLLGPAAIAVSKGLFDMTK